MATGGVPYRVTIAPRAVKELDALPHTAVARIRPRIDALATNPRPQGCEKLRGSSDHYRVRVGDYRIIYEISDAVLLVLVIRVAHRSDAYRP